MALQNKPLFDADAAEEYFVDLLAYYRDVANDIFKRDNEGRHASEQICSAEYQKFVGMQSAMISDCKPVRFILNARDQMEPL